MSASPSYRMLYGAFRGMSRSSVVRVYFGRPYLRLNSWVWRRLPASWRSKRPFRRYGSHVHHLIQLRERNASHRHFLFSQSPRAGVAGSIVGPISERVNR